MYTEDKTQMFKPRKNIRYNILYVTSFCWMNAVTSKLKSDDKYYKIKFDLYYELQNKYNEL